MANIVPQPADRYDYYPEPYGVRSITWQNTAAAVVPSVVLDTQNVADWSTLILRNVNLGNPANPGLWTVSWYFDAQFTLLANTDQLVIPPQVPFEIALAIRAPFVHITSQSLTGAGSFPNGCYVGVSHYPAVQHLQPPARLIDVGGVVVPAGGTTTIPATFYRPGPATLNVACGVAVTWDLALSLTDPANVAHDSYRWLFTTAFGNVSERIYLPAMPVSLRIHNSDAAGRPFAGSLVSGVA